MATAEQRTHRWRCYTVPIATIRVCPKQRYRIIRGVVLEHNRERAGPVPESEVGYTSNVRVLIAKNRIIVDFGQSGEVRVS